MSKKILVVDDAALVYAMLKRILESNGYTVYEAHNGQEGIDAHKKHFPDLILLDVSMPVMNGIEALQEIRKNDKKVKIVMLSAVAEQQTVDEALALGANEFIYKPVSEAKVLEIVKKYI